MAQGVITEIGCKKLCRSHAGDQTLPAITQMIRRPPADTRYVWVKRSWLIRIYPNRDYLIQTVT